MDEPLFVSSNLIKIEQNIQYVHIKAETLMYVKARLVFFWRLGTLNRFFGMMVKKPPGD